MTDHAALTALIEARVLEEQEWAYNLRIRQGMHWHAIRGLALRPAEAGGLDRNLAISTLKDMVAAYRAAQGEIFGTREERIERRALEYDEVALIARAELARSAEGLVENGEVVVPPHLNEKAAKMLLEVRAAEAKMHGDDAAQRVDVEVTQRTQLDAEIDAVLERMDQLDAAAAADREDT